MTPIWPDGKGGVRPTRPCKRCGADTPQYDLMRPEHLRMVGWKPFGVNWCGHRQDVVPIPTPNTRVGKLRARSEVHALRHLKLSISVGACTSCRHAPPSGNKYHISAYLSTISIS